MRRPEHVLRYPESQQQDVLYRIEPVDIRAADIDYNGHGNYRSILEKYEQGLGLDSGMYMSELGVLFRGEVREGEEIIVHTRMCLVNPGEQQYEQWMTREGQPISAVVSTVSAANGQEQVLQDDLYGFFEEERARYLGKHGTSVKEIFVKNGLGVFIPRIHITRTPLLADTPEETATTAVIGRKIITFSQTLTTNIEDVKAECAIVLVDPETRQMVEIPKQILEKLNTHD